MFKSAVPMILTAAALLGGCAKEKPYEESSAKLLNQLGGKEFLKSDLDFCKMDDPCLWVPMVGKSPYEVDATVPHFVGGAKLVVTQLTETKLKVLEVEDDARFSDNINNFSPVAEFDIQHVDYKCAEDSLGECANEEVEDSEKPWQSRKYARVGGFTLQEMNGLPIMNGSRSCYAKVGQEPVASNESYIKNVEAGAVQIGSKSTYEMNPDCASYDTDSGQMVFNIDNSYAYIKASQLADSSYRPVEYPVEDQGIFGFFKTEITKAGVDYTTNYQGAKTYYLNRWSPNKKEIVYYLNEDFYKPKMANVLKATTNAIQTVNNSLEQAEAPIRIVLRDGRGKDPSDVKNSFLILNSDPQATGILGYGPTVADPRTGEILSGRTVMYYGSILSSISRAYDERVKAAIGQTAAKGQNGKARAATVDKGQVLRAFNSSPAMSFRADFVTIQERDRELFQISRDLQETLGTQMPLVAISPVKSYYGDAYGSDFFKKEYAKYQEQMNELAKHNYLHSDHVDFAGAVEKFVIKKKKLWDDLTPGEREEVVNNLLPVVFVPTLVHEFGHNLGLRHNFQGSNDPDNYYTAQERKELGINEEVTYSSIMDYAFSTVNELPVMGKYDIAALRYAYARKVETRDGRMRPVFNSIFSTFNKSDNKELRKFKYCTDENVGSSSLCNRHDQGSNRVEVVKHYLTRYFENYERLNKRGRRLDFSGYKSNWGYTMYLYRNLMDIRGFFDEYDALVSRGFQFPAEEDDLDAIQDEDERRNLKELRDIKRASDIAIDGLLSIINQHPLHCVKVVYDKEDPSAFKIEEIEPFPASYGIANGCEAYTNNARESRRQAVANRKPVPPKTEYWSIGKPLNDSLYVSVPGMKRIQRASRDRTQIDVRGNWIDRALALKVITQRAVQFNAVGTSSFGSPLDPQHSEYSKKIKQVLYGLVMNKLSSKAVVTFEGSVKGQMPFTTEISRGMKINKSLHPWVNGFFGLWNEQTSFLDVAMRMVKPNLMISSQGYSDLNSLIFEEFDATLIAPEDSLTNRNYAKIVEFKANGDVPGFRIGLVEGNGVGLYLAEQKEKYEAELASLPEEEAKVIQQFSSLYDKYGKQVINHLISKGLVKSEAGVKYLENTFSEAVALRKSFLALTIDPTEN